MTVSVTETNQVALDNANPNKIADALRNINVSDVLAALGTPYAETVACNASFQFQLTKRPMQGTLVMARKTGSYLAQTEVHPSCTLGASQYKVDYDTGIVTAETTDFNDTDEAVFRYVGLTKDSTGIAGTELAEKLAATFAA